MACRHPGLVVFTGLVLAVLTAACSQTIPVGSVEITPGVRPRMSSGQVADRVAAAIRSSEQQLGRALAPAAIDQMTATTADQVSTLEPTSPNLDVPANAIVWVIRARGTFVGLHRPVADAPASETGYFVISDADGTTLAPGFP